MKKTFALVLAVAMVMSLAAVSFAAVSPKAAAAVASTQNDQLQLTGPYKYDGDIDSGAGGVKDATLLGNKIEYGKAAYWLIEYKTNGTFGTVSDYKMVEKLKVKAKWEMGSEIVEGLSIVKKRVDGRTAYDNVIGPKGYAYFVEVKTAAKELTSDTDIVGTLTFNMKASDDNGNRKFDDAKIDITVNVFYGNSYMDNVNYEVKGDKEHLKYDTKYLLKFNYDDEVELSFGNTNGGDNEGTFTVDVSGQGKILFQYNTKADEAIAAANPGAKLKFISFNNAKFNRTGEFAYEWEDGAYAYQVVDGKLTAIPGCEYDDTDETFYFHTRTLGSYVFSDVELVDAAVEAPVVTAPVETNPSTGAAA